MSLQESLKNKVIYKNSITQLYPQSIPQEFKNYLDTLPIDHPLNRQFIPHEDELDRTQGLYDPIGDTIHSKGNGIIHRYKNRLLFTPTTVCPIQCRYCFRKNELAQKDELFNANLDQLINYLQNNPQVNEVILTGGDPLMLSNQKIAKIFNALIELVPYIRFHTRAPIIIPSRIDREFIQLIKDYEKHFKVITMAIHTNHRDELYPAVIQAIKDLSHTSLNLISQTVLLKNVNNTTQSLVDLFEKLSELKVKPYYLHHPDKVKGAMHFYLPLIEGRKIYGNLREHLPGWMIPHYVIDPSSGKGKALAYNSEHLAYQDALLDRFGNQYSYTE